MLMIKVDTGSQDFPKLFKGVTSFGAPRFIGRQVSRDDVGRAWDKRSKVGSATHVSCRIDLLLTAEYGTKQIGISGWNEFGSEALCVAVVAIYLRIDDIAT